MMKISLNSLTNKGKKAITKDSMFHAVDYIGGVNP